MIQRGVGAGRLEHDMDGTPGRLARPNSVTGASSWRNQHATLRGEVSATMLLPTLTDIIGSAFARFGKKHCVVVPLHSISSGGMERGRRTPCEDFCTCLTRSLSLLAWLGGLRYHVWRWSRVLNTCYWISIPFVMSEGLLILVGGGFFYFQTFNTLPRRRKRLRNLSINPRRYPHVDVMIPTYKEPQDVIEATVRAALDIDYPSDKLKVYLLDDSNSAEVLTLTERLSKLSTASGGPPLKYVCRLLKPHEPSHAKAGNLNNAIFNEGTRGEYILLLDCDMICKPVILQALLPHFFQDQNTYTMLPSIAAERVAMVQSPQEFYNVPRWDPLNCRSPLFYRCLMPGWDLWSSAPCCGTNVLFQRKALCSVGGFAYGSVTEDFLTSLNLHAAGYTTRYVSEPLATGLAPDGLQAYFDQRLRWAVGGLQIFRFHCPLLRKGKLTVAQRTLYSWAGAHYMLAIPTLLVIVTPFIFLLGDGAILLTTGSVTDYLSYFCPYFLTHLVVVGLNHRRIRSGLILYLWRSQQETVFLTFNAIKAVLIVLLGTQFSFKVTPKDGRTSAIKDFAYALLPVFFVVLGMASIITGTLKAVSTSLSEEERVAYAINLVWAALMVLEMMPPITVLVWLHCISSSSQEHVLAGRKQSFIATTRAQAADEAALLDPHVSVNVQLPLYPDLLVEEQQQMLLTEADGGESGFFDAVARGGGAAHAAVDSSPSRRPPRRTGRP